MKTLIAIIFSILFLMPSYALSQEYDGGGGLGALRLSLMDGDVQVRTEESGEWSAASINMPLREGDGLWVPAEGRAELQLGESYVRLDEYSSLEILSQDGGAFQFYLQRGRAYVNFKGQGSVQFDTPLASARAYEDVAFKVKVNEDGYSSVAVIKGLLDVESASGKAKAGFGKTLSIGEDNYAEISPSASADEWERWNRDRDRRLYADGYSSRYLPDELAPYSYDLDSSGRWAYATGYGYVWTPTAIVYGWAPYRTGRWVWMGGDYVWVSYEPWGWAPYHYGRWAFVASFGWCWVPPARGAVYWGPGYVGWVYTPDYVAWVPLAPGDTYYGRGYYGPGSVNIININVQQNIIYKNVNINDSITVINRRTFVTGRHEDIKIKENPFLRDRISAGRPDIKPERETFRPVIKDVPERKRPPAPVRELRAREIKEKLPFVKDRQRPVRAETPLRKMPVREKAAPAVRPQVEVPRGKPQRPEAVEKQPKRIEEPKPSGRKQAPEGRQERIQPSEKVRPQEKVKPVEKQPVRSAPAPSERKPSVENKGEKKAREMREVKEKQSPPDERLTPEERIRKLKEERSPRGDDLKR